jgi:hypothetical protein
MAKHSACSVKSVVVAGALSILTHGLTRTSKAHCTDVNTQSNGRMETKHTSSRRSFTSAEHALLLDDLGSFTGRGF